MPASRRLNSETVHEGEIADSGGIGMKAAIYNGQGDIETPVCGDHDVLIRNLFASVCGSDVSAFLHGPGAHRISPGSEFGHEVVSEVAAVGRSVKGVEVGQRVYPYPLLARGDTSRAGTLWGLLRVHPRPQL